MRSAPLPPCTRAGLPPLAPLRTARPADRAGCAYLQVAMTGKNCVAIASDQRFGQQQLTLSTNMNKCFKMHDQLFLGMSGLVTDIQTLHDRFQFKMNLYSLKEDRLMKPRTFANVVASTLYERRFGPYFVEPVIAGLENGVPYICGTDLIGAKDEPDDFIVSGTPYESLLGMAESLWRPDMEPDELFEVTAQTLMAATDRDCLSGWGGIVHVITPTEVITKTLKGRMD